MQESLHLARRSPIMQMESNMKTAFFQSNDFAYFAEVTKVGTINDEFNLKITSQWFSAKNPSEQQTQLQVTCSRTELLKLAELLTKGVCNV
jgi:hypothetical protein